MPRFICKLSEGDKTWYLEWSTIIDAPLTHGMPLDEFREYYCGEYSEEGMRGLDERMARVEAKGTSSHDYSSAEELMRGNRAGPKEESLTMAEIIEEYCKKKHPAEETP